MKKPRLTAAFQMHQPPGYLCNGEKYLTWLENLTIPVYMREQHPEYPTSIAYPFEAVYILTAHVMQGMRDLEKLKFFTSSVAWAIALAVLQGRPRIDLYGVELVEKTEYEKQRENYTFWVGFAAGCGIPLNIYGGNRMFQQPLYGA